MSLRVAVLMGGNSAEAQVSRASAGEVAKALQLGGHAPELLELDATLAPALLDKRPDVVFPALHGPPGEDGTVQGFLEMLGLPYVGSGVHGSAVAMDKGLAKEVFRGRGLPVAEHVTIEPDADPAERADFVVGRLGESVVIKPLGQGSAIGVTIMANGGDLTGAIENALRYGGGALIEPYLLGREITVGVLDLTHEQPRALPVIEIRTALGEWYDYTNRYTAGKSEHIIPAPLSEPVNLRLQEIAIEAHRGLRLADLSRADFIVTDADEIYLLEVNTLPGMTPTSLYPDGARALGLEFPALVDALVMSAHERGPRIT